ncbi:hypothetical protein BEL04_20135 [Mucilaginibacter sp. PPCGB 2223]|uniref:hypothetical protein n=1 Tax=Mucilaginibacter sp. PPCGB 2223 TaxID=1886027 RepID=UPI0008242661|nr:hypothetical protein [Mucilaginibacter sp. PPCGB 2223]OCX51028.1 hypothetical protein BEL04_20135 [Mucilaginibacter sp. PPCGB 2223]
MNDFGNLSRRSVLAIFAAFGLLFAFVLIYWNHQSLAAKEQSLNINFVGTVNNVSYDVKGIPNITIGDKEFYLGSGYHFDYQIQKGDSLIKKKGSNIYKLIKSKSGKTLEFSN